MREIERYLEEGKKYIESEDIVQASEKLYKAAEEAVKKLAQVYADGVWKEAEEKGRWTSSLLFKAVVEIAKKLNQEEIRHYWAVAWTLHVEGFHEGRLDINYIKEEIKGIEELVKIEKEASPF